MRRGTLIRDAETNRMVIRYNIKDYSEGLHCGTSLEVKLGNHWIRTRIEHNGSDWYLVGVPTDHVEGLCVRTGKETSYEY